MNVEKFDLEKHTKRLEELKVFSRSNKELLYTALRTQKQIRIKKGLKEVVKAFKKEDVNQIAVCILSTQANPAYILNPLLQLVIERNIPIFYTDSNQFICSLHDKNYKAICGLVYCLNQIPLLSSFFVK